ncbi:hypothetical protein [Paenibacillus sp. JMULE4]|nr:hypothetical protein [Paenibacillus sp. JMULE4]
MKQLRPGMRTERIQGVGHMIYKEAPALTAEYIISFIEGLDIAAAQ